jgi:hypothetical protein
MDQPGLRFLWVALVLVLFSEFLTGCGAGAASASHPAPGSSYQATVTAPAAGAGIVTSSPPGINCPPTCSASFAPNTIIKLSAAPSAGYIFGGWNGNCSGTGVCNLVMDSPEKVTPIFSSANANVVAYVFTADALELKSSEFALLSDGELQVTGHTLQPMVFTGTAHGLVAALPTFNGRPTSTLQSYVLKADGSLRPAGQPVTLAMDQFVSLASDQNYVYATTDEGLFAFVDQTTGLSPLLPIQQTIPPPAPCTPAQENANLCRNAGVLMLSNANAFLLQMSTGQFGPPLYELSAFDRSQGQLTAEQFVAGGVISTGIFAPTPDGNFVYAMDLASNRVFRYARNGNGSFETNVLANGQQLADGFIQLIMSANGSFLFGAVSDSAESPRIRVFRITASSGALTEVNGSPFLTGEYYMVGATLDPTGHFLLAVHSSCNGSPPCMGPGKLVAMRINPSTGTMSVASDVEDGQDPYTVSAVSISQ